MRRPSLISPVWPSLLPTGWTTRKWPAGSVKWPRLQYERVGLNLRPELVAVKEAGNKARFLEIVKKVAATPYSIILMSFDPAAMKEALDIAKDKKPLIYAATKDNADAMGALAKEYACPWRSRVRAWRPWPPCPRSSSAWASRT